MTAAQAAPTNGSTDSGGWPAPRADAGRTGATADDGPLPYANTSWTASNSGRDPWVGDPVGPATTADGTVFLSTRSDTSEFFGYENRTGLYALNDSTGETEWRVNATFGPPVAAAGYVFASERPVHLDDGDQYGNVTALDPSTGERAWTSDVRGTVLAYADGRLIVGEERSDTLYALDAEDGSTLWETGVEESVYLEDEVAVGEDAVYVTSGTDPYPIENAAKTVTALAVTDGSRL